MTINYTKRRDITILNKQLRKYKENEIININELEVDNVHMLIKEDSVIKLFHMGGPFYVRPLITASKTKCSSLEDMNEYFIGERSKSSGRKGIVVGNDLFRNHGIRNTEGMPNVIYTNQGTGLKKGETVEVSSMVLSNGVNRGPYYKLDKLLVRNVDLIFTKTTFEIIALLEIYENKDKIKGFDNFQLKKMSKTLFDKYDEFEFKKVLNSIDYSDSTVAAVRIDLLTYRLNYK